MLTGIIIWNLEFHIYVKVQLRLLVIAKGSASKSHTVSWRVLLPIQQVQSNYIIQKVVIMKTIIVISVNNKPFLECRHTTFAETHKLFFASSTHCFKLLTSFCLKFFGLNNSNKLKLVNFHKPDGQLTLKIQFTDRRRM